ncbi:MAG: sigma-54-dependent Fis family transcriptional regulator [Firmicutes bacterium]|nr:sigma-54-dependent Fis family transcriptional regulator [Bacillota bacterium]
MPIEMQAKLLRVIQEKEFERVGGIQSIRTDARIVCATNKDLPDLVTRGKFRQDLYYRLAVVVINMPPLRRRREDIPLLVSYLAGKIANEAGVTPKKVSPAVIEVFRRYEWPGNVRELCNVLEKLMNVVEGDEIRAGDLPFNIRRCTATTAGSRGTGLKKIVSDTEKDAILDALHATGGNRKQAAAMLGLARSAFYRKMRAHDLIKPPPPGHTA